MPNGRRTHDQVASFVSDFSQLTIPGWTIVESRGPTSCWGGEEFVTLSDDDGRIVYVWFDEHDTRDLAERVKSDHDELVRLRSQVIQLQEQLDKAHEPDELRHRLAKVDRVAAHRNVCPRCKEHLET